MYNNNDWERRVQYNNIHKWLIIWQKTFEWFLYFISNILASLSWSTLGNSKQKYDWQHLTRSILPVWTVLIKNLFTTKSNEFKLVFLNDVIRLYGHSNKKNSAAILNGTTRIFTRFPRNFVCSLTFGTCLYLIIARRHNTGLVCRARYWYSNTVCQYISLFVCLSHTVVVLKRLNRSSSNQLYIAVLGF